MSNHKVKGLFQTFDITNLDFSTLYIYATSHKVFAYESFFQYVKVPYQITHKSQLITYKAQIDYY